MIRAGGDGGKQIAHFRHHKKHDHTDLCELRVAQEVAEKERAAVRVIRPSISQGQSMEAFLAAFEQNVLRMNPHFHAGTVKLLNRMRLRPAFRRSVFLQRDSLRMLCLTGVPHSGDGHLIRPLITRYHEIMVEHGETEEYFAVWQEGMIATLRFMLGGTAFPALLFAVSLGLITALSKGLSDQPMYDNGIDMHQLAIDARLADFCAFTELQFRAFAKRPTFSDNAASIYSNALMHTAVDFVAPLIREHSEQKAA